MLNVVQYNIVEGVSLSCILFLWSSSPTAFYVSLHSLLTWPKYEITLIRILWRIQYEYFCIGQSSLILWHHLCIVLSQTFLQSKFLQLVAALFNTSILFSRIKTFETYNAYFWSVFLCASVSVCQKKWILLGCDIVTYKHFHRLPFCMCFSIGCHYCQS